MSPIVIFDGDVTGGEINIRKSTIKSSMKKPLKTILENVPPKP